MNELRTYTITATLGSTSNTVTFQDTDDTEATYTAMFKILDAASKARLWAKGEIVLAGPDGVIRTMPAKADA
jgi:hypothetical protein